MFDCKYSNIGGIPGKGIHKKRIFGLAAFDLILTIIAAIVFSCIFDINFIFMILFLFGFGIIIHRLLCVRTVIDKKIFPNCP